MAFWLACRSGEQPCSQLSSSFLIFLPAITWLHNILQTTRQFVDKTFCSLQNDFLQPTKRFSVAYKTLCTLHNILQTYKTTSKHSQTFVAYTTFCRHTKQFVEICCHRQNVTSYHFPDCISKTNGWNIKKKTIPRLPFICRQKSQIDFQHF